MAVNRCRVCGGEYKLCVSCERNKSWKRFCDTLEHYYIFSVLMKYRNDRDRESAREALERRGIKPADADGFLPAAAVLIREILSVPEGTVEDSSGGRPDGTETDRTDEVRGKADDGPKIN